MSDSLAYENTVWHVFNVVPFKMEWLFQLALLHSGKLGRNNYYTRCMTLLLIVHIFVTTMI